MLRGVAEKPAPPSLVPHIVKLRSKCFVKFA